MRFLDITPKRRLTDYSIRFAISYSIAMCLEVLVIPMGWWLLIALILTAAILRVIDVEDPRMLYFKAKYRNLAPRLTANYPDDINPYVFDDDYVLKDFITPSNPLEGQDGNTEQKSSKN